MTEQEARIMKGMAPALSHPDPWEEFTLRVNEVERLRSHESRQRRMMCWMVALSWAAGVGMCWAVMR